MNKIKRIIASLVVCASLFSATDKYISVSATTMQDVIDAARNEGNTEADIQQLIIFLQSDPDKTSDEYDQLIDEIKKRSKNEVVGEGIGQIDPVVSVPQTDSSSSEEESKKYSSLTEEEKNEYINSLTDDQKNQILKGMDKDRQLEILKGMIDSGSKLGINLTVDEMTGDSINYSIRDKDGKLIGKSAIGLVVDDTGIDYTKLIAGAFFLFIMSSYGIAVLWKYQKCCQNIGE